MKQTIQLLATAFFAIFLLSCNKRSGPARVLVFAKTAGFRHTSIPAGKAAIMKLGRENNFIVDTTEDANYIQEDSLKNYAAVIFLHTTGNILDNYQEADLERFIQAGGGFVGIHAASDAEYDWGWYGRMVGGYFESHPQIQQATIRVNDENNISTKHLPKEWKRTDEWYNFKKLSKDVKVLLSIDEKSYQGGKNGDNHPMAWYHDFDGGRAFYTELGHTDESFADDLYLKHLLGGIQYAIGDNKNLDYGDVKSQRVPDENRFSKTMLTQGQFTEPTEMTILPNLDILVAQRRGELMLYKKNDSMVKQAGLLNVYWKTHTKGVNAEEGLMGLQADPDFAKNHYIYLFYSPVDTSVNRLSRFTFVNDTLDLKTEKVVLQFYSQREICCHTGGSIAFGGDNLLYLSTGDNSTPFDEANQRYASHGYAPLDDRPGHNQFDARRTAGNPNDLRGKILRIRIKSDATYDIPDNNLFAKNQQGTKPEIYVMGNRNPYRISVDKKNGFLYWGEVGPDANADSIDTRGPRGYDEVNQARKAGYFGWPLFVGNNYPYHQYDYGTGQSGNAFDPAKPLNNSRNNTGLQNLPPAQPAFIWYPYGESTDFPQVGTGGRNAMAGPVYYSDMYPKETRYPDYYNGKFFSYDWIRGWIKPVTLSSNGDFDKMEPFIPHTKLFSPIDIEMGPDGRLYILEYGSGWFSKNADAGLSRIDYNGGNRAPKIEDLQVSRLTGSLPFHVTANVTASDPEKGSLKYNWNFGDGSTKETTEPTVDHTYTKNGDYLISVEVKDKEGVASSSNKISLYAGNETPDIMISVSGNQTFFFPNKPVQYEVSINDKDDTSSIKDMNDLIVSVDYLQGSDRAAAPQGHQILTEAMIGRNMMLSLDCKSCHQIKDKSVGPSFEMVAQKYSKDPNAMSYLSDKIIKGGSGVWGEVAMAAHPTLKEEDTRQIIQWIMTLSGEAKKQTSLGPKGTIRPPATLKDNTAMYIAATFTDKGTKGSKPLIGNSTIALANSKMNFRRVKTMNGYAGMSVNGMNLMVAPKTEGWFAIDSIDLTSVSGATIQVMYQQAPEFGFTFELRLDASDGKKIGEASLAGTPLPKGKENKPVNPDAIGAKFLNFTFTPVTDGKKHNLYVVSKPKDQKESNQVALQWIEFKAK
ncbi:MAG TPA: ThuA domain-containing protein [Flavitalea sp.]|nr:ThuA domain-containing protein [Flavitalea sp.]